MAREQDQAAFLLDGRHRTVALEAQIRHLRAVAPDVSQ